MGLTNYPNGISSFGMPVIPGAEAMIPPTTGSVFFVDSTTGSNGNSGTDGDNPFATIDYAIGQCTANKGDVIIVMPNHAEAVASAGAIAADIAGISIIGLGRGDDRPTLTFGTTEAADINFTADNILVRNFKFDLTGIDAVAAALDVDAAYCTIDNCEILMADTGGQATVAVDVGVSSHYFAFTNNHVIAPNDGATAAIQHNLCNDMTICGNKIFGDFDTGCIVNTDGTNATACLRALVTNNYIYNTDTDSAGFSFGASTVGFTGLLADNYIGITGTAAGTLVGFSGQSRLFNNYITSLATTQGELLPAADGIAT